MRVAEKAATEFNFKGLMVIDVVEGSALASLSHMKAFIKNRPRGFASETAAVHWSLQTHTVRNVESARVSIPSQIVAARRRRRGGDGNDDDNDDDDHDGNGDANGGNDDNDHDGDDHGQDQTKNEHPYEWRTNLVASEPYWDGWFRGLSQQFLSLTCQKALLLAGTDRLDTPLTRGQMEGKFQLLLMYGCGHVIQEDNPDKTANAILNFCGRVTAVPGLTNTAQEQLQAKLNRARRMMPPSS